MKNDRMIKRIVTGEQQEMWAALMETVRTTEPHQGWHYYFGRMSTIREALEEFNELLFIPPPAETKETYRIYVNDYMSSGEGNIDHEDIDAESSHEALRKSCTFCDETEEGFEKIWETRDSDGPGPIHLDYNGADITIMKMVNREKDGSNVEAER